MKRRILGISLALFILGGLGYLLYYDITSSVFFGRGMQLRITIGQLRHYFIHIAACLVFCTVFHKPGHYLYEWIKSLILNSRGNHNMQGDDKKDFQNIFDSNKFWSEYRKAESGDDWCGFCDSYNRPRRFYIHYPAMPGDPSSRYDKLMVSYVMKYCPMCGKKIKRRSKKNGTK